MGGGEGVNVGVRSVGQYLVLAVGVPLRQTVHPTTGVLGTGY